MLLVMLYVDPAHSVFLSLFLYIYIYFITKLLTVTPSLPNQAVAKAST